MGLGSPQSPPTSFEAHPSDLGEPLLTVRATSSGLNHVPLNRGELFLLRDQRKRGMNQVYGGGAFRISSDIVIFSNYKDQRLYKQSIDSKGSSPIPITPDYGAPSVSYADGVFDSRFNRYITVREVSGREFRERLLGRWGIVDVDDCCSCAKFLVDIGKVDGKRLCITGGSAGGYTTLAALAFKDTFKAGASLYGDSRGLRFKCMETL